MTLKALIRDENDGILVPIPQYPLYSAAIQLFGGTMLSYYLDESAGWAAHASELERSIGEARARGINVRAMTVINPGNPTGQCASAEEMRNIVKFCKQENLVLLADEVYQENIWHNREAWQSFKKVLMDMGPGYADTVELCSFHSVSKGFLGECGRRGGYVEMVNFDADVKNELYKLASVNLCSNVDGQIMAALMCSPPEEGTESFALYNEERTGILESLKRRAVKLVAAYRQMEGVSCNDADGALYLFPKITLPEKAIAAAKAAGKAPDAFYCLTLLDETGIVCVPGSGFGQVEGTFHYRSTILPPEDKIDKVISQTAKFHAGFMNKYR